MQRDAHAGYGHRRTQSAPKRLYVQTGPKEWAEYVNALTPEELSAFVMGMRMVLEGQPKTKKAARS